MGKEDTEVSTGERNPEVDWGREHRSEPGVGRPRGGSGREALDPGSPGSSHQLAARKAQRGRQLNRVMWGSEGSEGGGKGPGSKAV